MATLTSKIQALLTYANGITSKEDTTLGDAVKSLGDGFGGGGDDSILKSLIERNITSIDIPNSVTNIGNSAFCNCTSLQNVTFPNSVTNIGNSAFYNCTSLQNVTFPNSVTKIGISAFYNCTSLQNVTFPNSVTKIGNSAFYNCTSLQNVTFPSSVKSLDNGAFNGCKGIKKMIFLGYTTFFNGALNNLSSLEYVIFHDKFAQSNANFYNANKNLIVICLSETPFSIPSTTFNDLTDMQIYVPSASVDAYKAQSGWSTYADKIQAITDDILNEIN